MKFYKKFEKGGYVLDKCHKKRYNKLHIDSERSCFLGAKGNFFLF